MPNERVVIIHRDTFLHEKPPQVPNVVQQPRWSDKWTTLARVVLFTGDPAVQLRWPQFINWQAILDSVWLYNILPDDQDTAIPFVPERMAAVLYYGLADQDTGAVLARLFGRGRRPIDSPDTPLLMWDDQGHPHCPVAVETPGSGAGIAAWGQFTAGRQNAGGFGDFALNRCPYAPIFMQQGSSDLFLDRLNVRLSPTGRNSVEIATRFRCSLEIRVTLERP